MHLKGIILCSDTHTLGSIWLRAALEKGAEYPVETQTEHELEVRTGSSDYRQHPGMNQQEPSQEIKENYYPLLLNIH